MVFTLLHSSLTICNTSSFPTQLNKLGFAVPFQHDNSVLSSYLFICFLNCTMFSNIQTTWYECSSILVPSKKWGKFADENSCLLLNAAFVMAILKLISRVYLPLFDIMLDKYFKYSKLSNYFSLPCFILGLIAFRIILHYFFHIHFNFKTFTNLSYCIYDAFYHRSFLHQ